MSRPRNWSLVVLAASTLGLAGCSSSSTTGAASAPSSTPAATATVQDPSPAGTFGTKPTVVVPPGAPPTQLESKDLIVGTGPAAKPGDEVTVQYVGVAYSSKQQFDASWDRGQPFQFVLGEGQVIKGWDEGVVGMQVGGRRELIIPPNQAYGANSPSAGIAPNDTLIFIVDLLKIN
ncbi:MAG: FKBP-type peptidyl-prolyl cis-trans isomerase [Acidimicrobiales bacterium]|jgi:peptidylprolyl isomerase